MISKMDPPRRRGPYKKYLLHGSEAKVPKRTRNYWKAKERNTNLAVRSDESSDTNGTIRSTSINELEMIQEHDIIVVDSDKQFCLPTTFDDDDNHSVDNDSNYNRNDDNECVVVDIDNSISENDVNQSDEDYHNYNYHSSSRENSSDDFSESDGEDFTEKLQDDDNTSHFIASPLHDSNSEIDNLDSDAAVNTHLEDTINIHQEDTGTNYQENTHYPKDVLIRTLLILATKLKKNLDNEMITHLASLIDAMIETPLAFTSTYHFKNIVDNHTIPIEIHHFCPTCGNNIGMENNQSLNRDEIENDLTLHCQTCNLDVSCSKNKQLGNIFLYLSLEEQLKHFCERHHQDLSYPFNRKKLCSYALEDLIDGYLYKNNYSSEELQNMISVNFSIDGTPLFKSSMTSITPILCTINEIHPHKRKQHVLLASVYLGSKKPKMNEYLKPFVNEAKSLFNHGFEYNYDGLIIHKKCRILMGVCDSVERPELRGSKTFRGAFGCGLCKHEGEEIAKGNGYVRIYPIDDDGNAHGEGLRSHSETLIHAGLRQKGMKHKSTLCDIPDFDIIKCLDVDWMHCVPLGVVRQFFKLWFDSSAEKDYYLGNNIDDIDKILLSFKPSMDVSRTPRKMSDRIHFKAHELVIWLLFYSLPILNLFLPRQYVKHWSLLVQAISLLLKTSILETEVYDAQRYLFNFVKDTETLYGREHISFNVHLLTHLPQSVLNWGPLWSHSAFCYENYHQFVKKLVKSSNAAGLQIMESFRSNVALEKLHSSLKAELTVRQRNLFEQLTNTKKKTNVSSYIDNIGLIGRSKVVQTLPMDSFLALQRINVNIDRDSCIYYYSRIYYNQETIHSQNYNRVKKRNNYTVLLKNSEIFEIRSFVVVSVLGVNECFALGKYFVRHNRHAFSGTALQHLYFINLDQNLAAVQAKEIKEKVTLISSPEHQILIACKHPNKFEMLT